MILSSFHCCHLVQETRKQLWIGEERLAENEWSDLLMTEPTDTSSLSNSSWTCSQAVSHNSLIPLDLYLCSFLLLRKARSQMHSDFFLWVRFSFSGVLGHLRGRLRGCTCPVLARTSMLYKTTYGLPLNFFLFNQLIKGNSPSNRRAGLRVRG